MLFCGIPPTRACERGLTKEEKRQIYPPASRQTIRVLSYTEPPGTSVMPWHSFQHVGVIR